MKPGRLRSLLSAVTLLALLLTGPAEAYWGESTQVPLRRSLPSAIDFMESGLYWLQDLSGVDNPRDPASIVALMEDQAARYFDFAYMSYLIAGPRYTNLDALERSHFQNRVRDRLFASLARHFGMYDRRMPTFSPAWPVRTSLYTWKGGGRFYHRNGPTVDLRFHFYLGSNGWRIYDVTSNGVSAVDELRAKFHENLFER